MSKTKIRKKSDESSSIMTWAYYIDDGFVSETGIVQ